MSMGCEDETDEERRDRREADKVRAEGWRKYYAECEAKGIKPITAETGRLRRLRRGSPSGPIVDAMGNWSHGGPKR